MTKGDHTYTLNHTIDTLKQQLVIIDQRMTILKSIADADDDKDDVMIQPSSNYRVEEDKEPNQHTMIHHIDDLPNLIDCFLIYKCVLMLKELFGDRTTVLNMNKDNIMYLIYNSDDLNSLFSNLKTQDMNPQ